MEFVCSSVTSNNLKDITGSPPRTTSVAVEEGIKANNRHVKYLNFDDHGFSVLDLTPQRAQMDWFVISDRADRDATITARGVVGDAVGDRPDRGRRPAGRGCPMSATAARASRRTFVTAGAAGLLFSSVASPALAGARAASGPTCWWSTAAGPTRSRRA